MQECSALNLAEANACHALVACPCHAQCIPHSRVLQQYLCHNRHAVASVTSAGSEAAHMAFRHHPWCTRQHPRKSHHSSSETQQPAATLTVVSAAAGGNLHGCSGDQLGHSSRCQRLLRPYHRAARLCLDRVPYWAGLGPWCYQLPGWMKTYSGDESAAMVAIRPGGVSDDLTAVLGFGWIRCCFYFYCHPSCDDVHDL